MIVINSVFYFQGEKHFKSNEKNIFVIQIKIWHIYNNVYALFHMYICYNCYVNQRRRFHTLETVVSDPFCQ
jgi:hypothetical protein